MVNADQTTNRPLSQVDLAETGTLVHLKAYGFIKGFKMVKTEFDIEYWATNDLEMCELKRLKYAEISWMIETYHRGIKQFCGIERCQARGERAQRNHIALALRAFLRLEYHSFIKGISWFEAKTAIIRDAVRAYLAQPLYPFSFSPPSLYCVTPIEHTRHRSLSNFAVNLLAGLVAYTWQPSKPSLDLSEAELALLPVLI